MFFGGQIVSLIGSFVENVALSWLVFELTGSVADLGTVGMLTMIPTLFLAFIGGDLADKHKPKTILLLTQSLQLATSIVLLTLVI